MQRMAWTDERLEERFNAIDHRFDEIDRRFDEVYRRFDRLENEVGEVRRGVAAVQTTLNRIGAGIIIGLGGVIASILAKGV
jgi:hypothetical protein